MLLPIIVTTLIISISQAIPSNIFSQSEIRNALLKQSASSHAPNSQSNERLNVLFLAVDDMRPELGVFSDQQAYSYLNSRMHTPNIDSLAKQSLLLRRAFVQQALCNPSRTSLLTSRRPDTTHVYDLIHYFRDVGGNFTTIPEYFKQNGYTTAGVGKIFHPGLGSDNDDPVSWSLPYTHYPDGRWGEQFINYSWHGVDDKLLKQDPLPDMQIADHAVTMLKKMAKSRNTDPFFLAAGFHRPHLPFTVPQSFLDMYPLEDIPLPPNPHAPYDMPEIAWTDYAELRLYIDQRAYADKHGAINTTLPDLEVRKLRRAYYAAVSYTDYQIGKILRALKELGLENSTIISLWGDHGWNLGEHGEWCKQSNFEISTHSPMMVRVPGITDKGVVTDRLTEFVDLFPTLVEAAGLPTLPLCPEDSSKVRLCTEGVSFMPLMKDPQMAWKSAVFSQYPRMERGDAATRMGYTMRTPEYRYTEYPVFEYSPKFSPLWAQEDELPPQGELYDHRDNPEENWNYYRDTRFSETRHKLQQQLHAGWRKALPPMYKHLL